MYVEEEKEWEEEEEEVTTIFRLRFLALFEM